METLTDELPLLDILSPIDLATQKLCLAISVACDEAERGHDDWPRGLSSRQGTLVPCGHKDLLESDSH